MNVENSYYKLFTDKSFQESFFRSYEKLIDLLKKGGQYAAAIQHIELRDRLRKEVAALSSA